MNSKILVALVSVQTVAIIGLAAAVAMLWQQVEELPTREDASLLADEQTSKLSEQIQTVGYLASTRSSGPGEHYFDRQFENINAKLSAPDPFYGHGTGIAGILNYGLDDIREDFQSLSDQLSSLSWQLSSVCNAVYGTTFGGC